MKLLKAPCYYLDTFERNGYNDSDFFDVVFDGTTQRICTIEVGTTRFAGAIYSTQEPITGPSDSGLPHYHPLPDERILQAAEEALARQTFDLLKWNADYKIHNPYFKGQEQVVLPKAGKWKDKRASKVVTWDAGATGQVFWTGHYGTFYRKGYKKPNRLNQRIGVSLADGTRIFIEAEKAILNQPMPTDEELWKQANAHAKRRSWRSMVVSPFGYVNML